ncbi:MAG: sodium-dependent transporter [Porticoccaceae bacterium]|jgi:neurotransmitter:Na+ symporter, NSS family|nr:MAG: transporter [SAR92 bacterium BACL16 MAG-120619-bin48]MDP4654712.1 sodium-dependent transporter [Alphaproteobacteria bacterium]MDP4743679.1 sodium-dependent transporter [Porticoccaceae bacterium]MDP4753772.1 sodium-dependent transporter [Porticoccaceae bacterium]MDP4889602.1 sodium-dependent transporter [Porticoccaceae bacterium]
MQRGQFSSRLGFILAASGSAVGLGNIWGFPTNAAENGGAAFLLMYIILAFLLAYPALMAELIIGRHTRSNMVTALQSIASSSRAKTAGKLTGLGGILAATFILCFYSIIAGWMIAFMLEPVAHFFGMEALGNWLTEFSLARNLGFSALFLSLTVLVISAGVEQGIEKWSQRLMPSLFVLLAALIVYVLLQDGAMQGLKHYLVPDFSQMADPQLIVRALGQAFFSLSLGVGTMLIYGSYIRSDENLPVVGALVTLTDTGVAFLAGMLVLPAIFVAQELGVTIYGGDGSLIAGPDLIFQVLPALFDGMGTTGLAVGFAFFVLMTIAAVTSSISMLEVPVAYTVETAGTSRIKATWLIGLGVFVCSAVVSMNFDALFGLVVTLTTEWAQPLLGVMLCIFAGWIFNRNSILSELKQGDAGVEQGLFWKVWPIYVKFFCPLLILLTFAQGFF